MHVASVSELARLRWQLPTCAYLQRIHCKLSVWAHQPPQLSFVLHTSGCHSIMHALTLYMVPEVVFCFCFIKLLYARMSAKSWHLAVIASASLTMRLPSAVSSVPQLPCPPCAQVRSSLCTRFGTKRGGRAAHRPKLAAPCCATRQQQSHHLLWSTSAPGSPARFHHAGHARKIAFFEV
jgi:hypothetical protein